MGCVTSERGAKIEAVRAKAEKKSSITWTSREFCGEDRSPILNGAPRAV
jgi:hypothetical protein